MESCVSTLKLRGYGSTRNIERVFNGAAEKSKKDNISLLDCPRCKPTLLHQLKDITYRGDLVLLELVQIDFESREAKKMITLVRKEKIMQTLRTLIDILRVRIFPGIVSRQSPAQEAVENMSTQGD